MKSINTDPVISFLSNASSIISVSLATWSTVLRLFQNPACSLGNSLSTMGSSRVKSIRSSSLYVVHSREIGNSFEETFQVCLV